LIEVARERDVRETTVLRSRDPNKPNRALSVKVFPLPGDCVGLAVEDITESTRARRLREAEQHIFEMIAKSLPLPEVLRAVTVAIEEHSPPMIASILLLAEDGLHVRHGAAPSLPAAYNQAVAALTIGDKQGSCGTSMHLRRPVFVYDIETDPLWESYREIAREHQLRTCWSSPVLANDGRVLGSFALYYREPRHPSPEDEALITRAARITSIAIERSQLLNQLRALSAHVEAVREEERTGIAREVHDELGQSLTALKMEAAWLGRRAAESDHMSSALVFDRMQAMSGTIDAIIREVRRISSELRPGVLDDLGLAAAIEWQAQEFERRTGTPCSVASYIDDEIIDSQVATTVFRIFQEALTNVARHAEATAVQVKLERGDRWIVLEVRDDGRGISSHAATSPRSLGLLGVRERARNLGGAVSIDRDAAAGGTVLRLRLPLQPRDRDERFDSRDRGTS
jgi:signal transduction histidine kinase